MRPHVPVLPPHTVRIDGKLVSLDEKLVPYTAFVDDRPAKLVKVSPDRKSYELASDLDPAAIHEVRLVREAEAFAGVHEFLGVDLGDGGRMLDPKKPARRIELVGDSIMCGYGVLGKDSSCPFTYETERASLAYPFLVARALDAELSLMCWSGRGVYRNYGGDTTDTMPVLWERSLPEAPGTPFDFKDDPQPDTVFVALGTNDFLGGAGKPLDTAAFEDAYAKFLRQIRERRAKAKIVVAKNSPMISGATRARFAETIEHVIAKRRSEGDTGLDVVDLDDEGDRVGCDGHPNVEMQRLLAKQVETALRR